MSARILLIGHANRKSSLQRHWNVIVVPSGKQAIEQAETNQFDLVVVDAVSMRTSGERICRAVKKVFTQCPMIHIHPKSASEVDKVAEITLYPPVSARKLVGVINRLFDADDEMPQIRCGPFKMNSTTRILQAHGQEIQLNPKLADLLELFFTHPNEVIERETIMKQVWDTNYMGDTRTLDVHIRHARNVLENGNKKPRYLKTVRGVGYCLEVPVTPQK